jgi:hypothetical protein
MKKKKIAKVRPHDNEEKERKDIDIKDRGFQHVLWLTSRPGDEMI